VATDPTEDEVLIVEYAGRSGTLIVDGIPYPRGLAQEMTRGMLDRLVASGQTVDHPITVIGPKTKARTADPIEPLLVASARPAAMQGDPANTGGCGARPYDDRLGGRRARARRARGGDGGAG
jgi:hypothetical protein